MQIQRLQVSNIRNLSRISLALQPINIFYGSNGSGKTSLLEAVHLLLMGRSFRHAQLRPVLREGQDQAVVYAEMVSQEGDEVKLGLSRQRDGSKPVIKLNGAPVSSVSDLVQVAPIQLLSTDSFEMLTGGPTNRRQFLDWGLFHVEPRFYETWKLAQRALKQRNTLIRHGKIDRNQLLLWSREYARHGELVDHMRRQYIDQLLPLCQSAVHSLLPKEIESVLTYARGWPQEITLLEALEAGIDGDLQQGHTRSGPHRADLRVRVGSYAYAAADVLSRGQIKMLVASMYLAQAELLQQQAQKRSIFLLDDLAAELDEINRRRLCAELARLGVQVLATSIGRDELTQCWDSAHTRLFHVEQGTITQANLSV